ncbi:hypothetical protein ACNJQJ_20985, partial [Mycobacterium tuberculosis]
WFFAIVVNEVDRHHGLINKFAGDAALAIFGNDDPANRKPFHYFNKGSMATISRHQRRSSTPSGIIVNMVNPPACSRSSCCQKAELRRIIVYRWHAV